MLPAHLHCGCTSSSSSASRRSFPLARALPVDAELPKLQILAHPPPLLVLSRCQLDGVLLLPGELHWIPALDRRDGVIVPLRPPPRLFLHFRLFLLVQRHLNHAGIAPASGGNCLCALRHALAE